MADGRTRESIPAPPAAAGEFFGAALPVAEAYARMLAGPGVERGLIGPAETGRIWERHILNCAAVADLVPERCVLADLGSGAGLPGIVLAIARPQAKIILIEPMERRTAFLRECADGLSLANVEVLRGRGEDLAGMVEADVVTARAVARLDRLAMLAAGLARPGGLVLAMKGSGAGAELELARPVLEKLGATGIEIVDAGGGTAGEHATVVRFTTRADRDDRWPSARPVRRRR